MCIESHAEWHEKKLFWVTLKKVFVTDTTNGDFHVHEDELTDPNVCDNDTNSREHAHVVICRTLRDVRVCHRVIK